MFAVVVALPLLLSAAVERPRLLVMDLQGGTGVSADTLVTLTDFFTAYLGESGQFAVTSRRELTRLADLEAERQKADCISDTCLSEIAGALGAAYVAFGRVGRLGESWFVQLTLADVRAQGTAERRVVQAATVDELAPKLRDACLELTGAKPAAALTTTTKKPAPPPKRPPPTKRTIDDDDDDTGTRRVAGLPERKPRKLDDDDDKPKVSSSLAAAQKRVATRKADAAELRAEADRLTTAGIATVAGGVLAGLAVTAIGAAYAQGKNDGGLLAIGFAGGGCATCLTVSVAGGAIWAQGSGKAEEANMIDPQQPGAQAF
ncbi:MAG: hypothetical protein Q8O67_10020 [Deltaproteobacteria bacterium]|nr:hypothetical protein [Deltaproteobacteria bacterium]